MHCRTFYCIRSPSEVTFRVARRNLEVMSKIAYKLVALNFECTLLFATWWEAKWSEKYGEDLLEAHNRLFGQFSIKSYLRPNELESWKEMIYQKNQLFLIGIL